MVCKCTFKIDKSVCVCCACVRARQKLRVVESFIWKTSVQWHIYFDPSSLCFLVETYSCLQLNSHSHSHMKSSLNLIFSVKESHRKSMLWSISFYAETNLSNRRLDLIRIKSWKPLLPNKSHLVTFQKHIGHKLRRSTKINDLTSNKLSLLADGKP